jgi:hypothetical protein
VAIDVNYEFDISKWPVLKISAKDILSMYGPLYGVQPVTPKWTGLPYYTEPAKPQSVDQQIRTTIDSYVIYQPYRITASKETLESPDFMNLLAAVPELKELPLTVDTRIYEGELKLGFRHDGLAETYHVFVLYTPAGGNDTWSK